MQKALIVSKALIADEVRYQYGMGNEIKVTEVSNGKFEVSIIDNMGLTIISGVVRFGKFVSNAVLTRKIELFFINNELKDRATRILESLNDSLRHVYLDRYENDLDFFYLTLRANYGFESYEFDTAVSFFSRLSVVNAN
jgi:hypothetical protein